MSDAKIVATPMQGRVASTEAEELCPAKYPYRALIGSLMFIAVCTRPEISFPISYLSRYLDKYMKSHLTAGLRILRYPKGMSNYGMHYGGDQDPELRAFTDSDFADALNQRRSTSGELFKKAGGAIIWSASRQPFTTLSSCEAELVASCSAAKTALWLQRFLGEVGHGVKPRIQIDNTSNTQFYRGLKHVDIRYHFLREQVEAGNLDVVHVESTGNQADICTKNLSKPAFQRLRKLIGVKSCSEW